METDLVRRITCIQNKSDESDNPLEMLLVEAIAHYDTADLSASETCLRCILDSVHREGNKDTQAKASALLGIIHLERHDFSTALKWLQLSLDAVPPSSLPSWRSTLRNLINNTMVHLATKETIDLISHKFKQLKQDVTNLETEISANVDQLCHYIHTQHPSTPHSNKRPGENRQKADHQMHLMVYLLGRFDVRLEGHTPVSLCSNRKGRSLFQLLSTEPGRRHHKETLLDTFWPDEDPSIATGKLHIAASRLRRALCQTGFTGDILVFSENCYFLNDGLVIDSDVIQFEDRLETGRQMEALSETELAVKAYESAVNIYRGDYLEDAIGEEWPLLRRAQLEQDYIKIHSRLINHYFSSERYDRAEASCYSILQRDNLREDVHRKLMTCLYQKGQRIQALRLYKEVEELLHTELGVSPAQKTMNLAARIEADIDVPSFL